MPTSLPNNSDMHPNANLSVHSDLSNTGAISKNPEEVLALEQAAEWFATLNDQPDDETKQAWQHWLNASTENQKAWQQIEGIAQRFHPLRQTSSCQAAGNTLIASQQQSLSRRKFVTRTLALFASVGIGALTWRYPQLSDKAFALAADESTAIGEIRDLLLPDNTQLWLNSASAINIQFTSVERNVELVAGEIHIVTGKDTRPFFTTGRHGRLQALGTRFSVWQQQDYTTLAVYEGAVKVALDDGQSRIIRSGFQSNFSDQAITAPHRVNRSRASWIKGVLSAENTSLKAIVTELQRHHPGVIYLSSEVEALKVMGTFPLTDIDKTLFMLSDILPIQSINHTPWLTTIRAK